MSDPTFRGALEPLLAASSISTSDAQFSQLEKYYDTLRRWNERINLTALPLDGYPDSTLSRLIVESAIASTMVADKPIHAVDLGSGGGSPAIPLNIYRAQLRLTMVESKERKAAFLREAIRELNLEHASVMNARIEDLRLATPAHLVTVRAVKLDGGLLAMIHRYLAPGGRLLIFGARETPPLFRPVEYCQLPGSTSYLTLLARQ